MKKFIFNKLGGIQNSILRFLIGIVSTVICYLPILLGYFFYISIGPETFWESFAVIALMLVTLGGIQIWLFFIWIFILLGIVYRE